VPGTRSAESFAVVENGNYFRADPEQYQLAHVRRRVSRNLGKFPEHKLSHSVHLFRIDDSHRLGTDRNPSDFVPAGVRQVDRQRYLGIPGDVVGLPSCRGTAEIDGKLTVVAFG
jgi:hypothetical protein